MPPITIMLKPASGSCNMRCSYCFYADVQAHRETKNYGMMSLGTLEKIVRRAFIEADYSVQFVFQGGEPTLVGVPFYDALLKYEQMYNTRNLQVSNSIQTNGLVLDDEWIRVFRKGHFLVGVSLDGTEALHNINRRDAHGNATYERILENIDKLRAAKIEYNILCVVNQQIAENAEAVFHALEKHRFLQFIPCLDQIDGTTAPWSLKAEAYGQFLIQTYDLYEKRILQGQYVSVRIFDNWLNMLRGYQPENCGMSGKCGNYYLIEADGSVYPCDFYVLDQWKMGNILQNTFKTMGASSVAKAFIQESLPVPQECTSCKYYSLCRNGCKRDREPFGLTNAQYKTKYCEDYKLFFDARYERMGGLREYLDHHHIR